MSSHVEQIKQRLSVVDVVGSYIKLQKAGANHKAICPFHSEKAPSFYVSPPREIWHCFGCNRGGDMFEFVKQIEGVEFPEALRILADRAGVTIVRQDPKFINEKTRLIDILKEATLFYQKQLAADKKVMKYLWKRGLKNDTLKDFNVGFAPSEDEGWRHLFSYLKRKGYSGQEMEKAGLVIKKDASDYYDRFRGRIMFPLKDTSGRVVGFSGRIYGPEKEDVGKYINTPQTILYDKSKVLYGFDRAKMEIRKQNICILVEGQMDVLMAHQVGTVNTAAVSGTALTPHHLQIIKRLADNLIMAFDNDEAGLQAAKRNIDLALEKGLELKAISLPQGKDPADAILKSEENWHKSVQKAAHIIDFYLDVLSAKHKDDSRGFKLEVGKSVLPYLLSIQSEIDRNHWVSEIAKKISTREEAVFEDLKKLQLKKKKQELDGLPGLQDDVESSKKRRVLLEERIIGIALWKENKGLAPEFIKERAKDVFDNLEKSRQEKLALEAELYYDGRDDLEEELVQLEKELRKEILKERLEDLAEEVQKLEAKGDKGLLEKKLLEFREISKELAEV